ncbi:MAG: methionyl-tRNA formyltransferase [Desulfocucumaceae bacterium]
MKIVFMGTPDFAVPVLETLVEAGHSITGVITQPDRPRGRGKKVLPSPVKEKAAALGLPVYQPLKVRQETFIDQLKSLEPEIIIVAAFGQLLPAAILRLPPLGCVNVHTSLLPLYRGSAPIQRAVMNGERVTGITIMKMDEGLDSGDILLQSQIEIAEDDNYGLVHDRLSGLGARLLPEALAMLVDGRLTGIPQDHEKATFAPPIRREDEIISWQKSVKEIKNQVRGLNPWPGARTYLGDRVFKIWRLVELEGYVSPVESRPVPGQILGPAGGGLAVQCGDGPAVVLEMQIQGGKRLGAGDFLRGYKIEPGIILGVAPQRRGEGQ